MMQEYESQVESLGSFLKRERILRDVTTDSIASNTKISKLYIEALENDDFKALPGKAFIIGFLRSYARQLGIDENDVITRYLHIESLSTEQKQEEKKAIDSSPKKVEDLAFPIVLGSIILFIIFLLFYYFGRLF